MIRNIQLNFYLVKGKPVEIISSAENSDDNKAVEQVEKDIADLIVPLLKVEKKAVYFVTWEGDWIESGRLKNQTELKCMKMDCTPAEFRKAQKDLIKADAKALARPDKEESYE